MKVRRLLSNKVQVVLQQVQQKQQQQQTLLSGQHYIKLNRAKDFCHTLGDNLSPID